MERFHSVNYRYDFRMGEATAGTTFELPQRLRQSPAQGPPHHTLAVLSSSSDSYLLGAVPLASDDLCGQLTIDQTGTRGASGSASIHACWR